MNGAPGRSARKSKSGGAVMQGCLYYTANDVMEMLGISTGHAYKIVKQLNVELADKGFIVIAGRVPKKYFAEHYYGMAQAQ